MCYRLQRNLRKKRGQTNEQTEWQRHFLSCSSQLKSNLVLTLKQPNLVLVFLIQFDQNGFLEGTTGLAIQSFHRRASVLLSHQVKSVLFPELQVNLKPLNFRSCILRRLLLPPISADLLQPWPWLHAPPHAAAKKGQTKEKEEMVQYILSPTRKLPKNGTRIPKNPKRTKSYICWDYSLSCEVLYEQIFE